jgi:hypothetical protein
MDADKRGFLRELKLFKNHSMGKRVSIRKGFGAVLAKAYC